MVQLQYYFASVLCMAAVYVCVLPCGFPSTAGRVSGVTAMYHWFSDSLAFMQHSTLLCTVARVTASSLTCGSDVYIKRERSGIFK